jgi:hypothetical protein
MAYSSTMTMEATCSSESSVRFQRSTVCCISEDRALHNHLCENLRCYRRLILLWRQRHCVFQACGYSPARLYGVNPKYHSRNHYRFENLKYGISHDCFLLIVYDDHAIQSQRGILVTIAVDTESLNKPRNKLVFRLYVTVVSEMFV